VSRAALPELEHAPTVRQGSPELADPLVGLLVADRYRIIEPIGRGGMGVVYKVEHARIGKLIALKLLSGALARDPGLVARFEREAAMVSQLSHPNTVQVFDFGHADGLVYLAMEYLRGFDLGHVIREAGALALDRTARIVVQICSSLAEAHERGIVHRDLKPENVMVLGTGPNLEFVKVLDFGLAKLRESTEAMNLTLRGAIVGTPYYMPPEQIRGEPVGPAGDVYALGALMYTCLTGEVVFDGANQVQIFTKHLMMTPEAPSARAPGRAIPPGIDRVVLQALAKDPAQRFPHAAALKDALLRELSQGGVELVLDSQEFRALGAVEADAATRSEVELYERKLRRRGHAAWGVLLALLAAGGFAAHRGLSSLYATPPFDGTEREPNNTASTAMTLPFPVSVKGQLGKRLDAERSDRDFFRFEVPKGQGLSRLSLEPLPNLSICVSLYPAGSESAIARYCPGSPNLGLDPFQLDLPAGAYLLAVMQDRDAYTESGPPPVHENISDHYALELGPARELPGFEVEPNDAPSVASEIEVGGELRGALAWMRDVDVICAKPSEGELVFVVEDAPERPRAPGAVLQVTPKSGPDSGIPVRVHRGAPPAPSDRDVAGPHRTRPVSTTSGERACVELTLVPNPWAPPPLPLVAPAGREHYVVRVERR
jgi:serine/threonine protein kinase